MLIKVNEETMGKRYINESLIDQVFDEERECGMCWRVALGDGWLFFPKDENEPFKHWLDWQIGGDAWQREVDHWKGVPDGCFAVGTYAKRQKNV